MSSDALHFSLLRQLKRLSAEGIVAKEYVSVLHGDTVESLRRSKERSPNEVKLLKELSDHDFIAIQFIEDEHINLAVLERTYEKETLTIMDSMGANKKRNDQIKEVAENLLRATGNVDSECLEVCVPKCASQGLDLNICGVFAAALFERYFKRLRCNDKYALETLTEVHVKALRLALEGDFISSSLFSQMTTSKLSQQKIIDLDSSDGSDEGPRSTRNIRKKKANVGSESFDSDAEYLPDEDSAENRDKISAPRAKGKLSKKKLLFDDSGSAADDSGSAADDASGPSQGDPGPSTSKQSKAATKNKREKIPTDKMLADWEERKKKQLPIPVIDHKTSLAELRKITAADVAKDPLGEYLVIIASVCRGFHPDSARIPFAFEPI